MSSHNNERSDSSDDLDSPVTDSEISEERQQELLQEIEHKRSLRGSAAAVVAAVAILFSAFQMWIAARSFVFAATLPFVGEVRIAALQLLQVNTIHVTFALVLAFLLYPASSGDGTFSGPAARIVPGLRRRFGADHPATRTVGSVARGVRWTAVDREMNRITPIDAALAVLSVVVGAYTVTEFAEIQNRIRVLGFGATRTVGEMVPPLGVVPVLGDASYAYVIGVIGVLLVIEATRRTLGLYLALLVSLFVVYARYAYLIPLDAPLIGVLSTSSLEWGAIVQNLWFNTENGVFGIPVTVSVRFIYIFILFGAFLEMSGAGKWFIDLAYSATGRQKGGPAKASILSSGFMGMISGSSIANTVTTGAFTIPLMKRSGYDPEFSGAVEASASSGGQILPPVMGAAAFLIVEYTATPYSDVIIAAAVPAIVFFFGVWVMVHLEASRAGIGGVSADELAPLRPHLKRGWFYLVPVALLLYYLIVIRLSVARSAWFTIVAIVALIALVAAYNERTRLPLLVGIVALFLGEFAAFLLTGADLVTAITGGGGGGLAPAAAFEAAAGSLGTIIILVSGAVLLAQPRGEAPLLDYDEQVDAAAAASAETVGRPDLANSRTYRFVSFILKSMDSGARTATAVVVAVAAAGIIPGVISVTGLGPNLVALIRTVAGGSLILLLIITAIASIILGMGMPTTVTYIILVSILGPAISQLADLPLLAAHLFILYFGVIADITPPVAVAAYAASGIAQSEPFETGVKAFSLSLNKAIVPFAFVLSPGILLIRGTGTGREVHVIGAADLGSLGFVIPYVVIPILCVFLGVFALGPTIIGYLYTGVGRLERAAFGVSSLLLMAPGMIFNPVFTLLSAVGVGMPNTLVLDLSLRAVGGTVFVLLVAKNRREAQGQRPRSTAGGEPATD